MVSDVLQFFELKVCHTFLSALDFEAYILWLWKAVCEHLNLTCYFHFICIVCSVEF